MYINWNVVPSKCLSYEEINKFLDTHAVKRTILPKGQKATYKIENIRGKYLVIKNDVNNCVMICGFDKKDGLFKITTQPNAKMREGFEDKLNDKGIGSQVADLVNDDFKKIYGISIDRAFHTVKYAEVARAIKACVPSPINWAIESKFFKNQHLSHVKKADVSSAYPTEFSKRLPTMDGHKVINGRVEPNEEYPFAFYIKSQHVKIIEEDGTVMSTFDLENSPWYMETDTKTCGFEYTKTGTKRPKKIDKFNDIPAEEDLTILCKVSKYSFAPMMKHYYENKKTNDWYKLVMNSYIGTLHQNNNPKLSYLAAVILLRCSWNMNQRLIYLKEHECLPLLVNTDSIAWLGPDTSLTTN